MVRVLSIWLPQLPLDRLVRCDDPRLGGPFALTCEVKNALRLTHLNERARHAGLTPGLSIPDARAICPDLLTEPCDKRREMALLRALWRWADQLSPRVALDAPDGLVLDITGCANLFGGEEAMGDEARARLADMQITARIGIGDTKGAARAMARFGDRPVSIAPAGDMHEALKPLPLEALDIPAKMVSELGQSGLKTIGQLYQVKSSELARRFGLELTKALGTSTGQEPDPVSPAAADPVYAARMTLPEPIGFQSDLENVLRRLAASVCGRLQDTQNGARRFILTVRCVDTGDHPLSVGFAKPCFEVGPILQQFARPLDELKIDYGADWFRLEAQNIEPIRLRQAKLGQTIDGSDSVARAISTIGNRIGFDHVHRFAARNSHLPEHEFTVVQAVDGDIDPVWVTSPRRRPVRLYKRPEYLRALEAGRPPIRFEWRKKPYRTASAKGPERLTAQWWCEGDMRTRDYWQVQTDEGLRLWLVTYPGTELSQWYVAGKFL